MDTYQAPALLSAWMEKNGVKHSAIADAVKKSPAAVYGWLARKFRPEGDVRRRLALFTRGEIAEDAWLTPQEQRDNAVEPFSPAEKGAA